MSFSSDVKTELSKLNNLKNKHEVYAELMGYLSSSNINKAEKLIRFSTENEYNINRFSKLLENTDINDYNIEVHNKVYIITFKGDNRILKSVELNTDNLKKSYIRGAFLGGGSINNPQNKYHLEISFNDGEHAQYILELINSFEIKAKVLDKSNILYIKEGEEISKFLALIGANSAVIKFEEIRVVRDMKNNINRLVNCETANINKTINASVEQISDIKKLRKMGKFDSLPDELKRIAILREKNPDATYEELANMLEMPISKSSVSHRFKRIKEELDN